MKKVLLAFICVSFFALNAYSQTPEKVAVFPFTTNKDISHETVEILYTLFVGEARKRPEYEIVSVKDVEKLLDLEQKKQMMGCTESSCATEIAGALGVDSVIQGTIAKLEEKTIINIARINAESAKAIASFQHTTTETGSSELASIVEYAVKDVLPSKMDKVEWMKSPTEVKKKQKEENGGRVWSWVSYSVGAVGLGVLGYGLYAYSAADSDQERIKTDKTISKTDFDNQLSDNETDGKRGALMINIGAGVAVAGLIAGTVLLFVEGGSSDDKGEKEAAFKVMPLYNGLVMGFGF